jgi:hypothetical protein
MEDIMKNTSRTYVMTMNSPSQKGFRLWTGKSIHALRHCSVMQISHALGEMQQQLDQLRATVPATGAAYSLNRSR